MGYYGVFTGGFAYWCIRDFPIPHHSNPNRRRFGDQGLVKHRGNVGPETSRIMLAPWWLPYEPIQSDGKILI